MKIEAIFGNRYGRPHCFPDLQTLIKEIGVNICGVKEGETKIIRSIAAEKLLNEQRLQEQVHIEKTYQINSRQGRGQGEITRLLEDVQTHQSAACQFIKEECQRKIDECTKLIGEHEQNRARYLPIIFSLILSDVSFESLASLEDLLKTVSISGLSITDSTIDANTATIIKGLLENSLTYLSLKGSEITDEGASILANAVQEANSTLKTFNTDGIKGSLYVINLLEQVKLQSTSPETAHPEAAASATPFPRFKFDGATTAASQPLERHPQTAASAAVGEPSRVDSVDASRELPENLVHETIKNDQL